MKFHSRVLLVSCLLTSIIYGQQRFFLSSDNLAITTAKSKDLVVKDSEDLNLEHAFFDYQHYYAKFNCDHKDAGMDLQVAPFYTYLKTVDCKRGDKTTCPTTDTRSVTQIGGAQFQVQLNFHNYYFRANTAVANIKSTFADNKHPDKSLYSFTGFDDVTAKIGHDWYFCNKDHHAGIYILGGFPGNSEKIETFIDAEAINTAEALSTTKLGILSYRAGAGFNGAVTLSNHNEKRLTWHADIQYAYAFPRLVDYSKLNPEETERNQDKYTPGQFVSMWTALHYAFCKWGFEIGSTFATAFDEKTITEIKFGGIQGTSVQTFGVKPGYNIEFTAKPYMGASYNTTICNNPLSLGLAVGYEYNKMHTGYVGDDEIERSYDAFQGVNVWGNVTYSF